MLNLVRYVKTDPATYLIQYRKGKVRRQGSGLSFFYFAPSSTLVSVPLVSVDLPFMFAESTADFQEITLQGRVVYRIADPLRLSGLVNYALRPDGKGYVSDGPDRLNDRVLNQVQVAVRAEIAPLALAEALTAGARLTEAVSARLRSAETLEALGLAVMDLAILAVKPTPETARALAAEMRERVLQDADQAVYRRRNATVDEERAIRENELQTDIAVAEKRRQVEEAEMEAKRAVAEKARTIEREDLEGRIASGRAPRPAGGTGRRQCPHRGRRPRLCPGRGDGCPGQGRAAGPGGGGQHRDGPGAAHRPRLPGPGRAGRQDRRAQHLPGPVGPAAAEALTWPAQSFASYSSTGAPGWRT